MKESERRIFRRIARSDLREPAAIRIPDRPAVSLVDLSAGGALLELPFQVRPDSRVPLEVQLSSERLTVPFHVLRCYVTGLNDGVRYQAAGTFERPLDLPPLTGGLSRAAADRLLSMLEELQRQRRDGRLGIEPGQFDALLARATAAVRRREPAAAIAADIKTQLATWFPSLAIGAASAAFLPDPSKSARFFGLDFTSDRTLTFLDRRFLRASAHLMTIIDADSGRCSPVPVDPGVCRDGEERPLSVIAYTVADWLTMCREDAPLAAAR